VSSKRPSDLPCESGSLDRLDEDLPTTRADVAALRRARHRRRDAPLTRIDLLSPPDWAPHLQRRGTAAGWEPFEL
jgi:hypothetical protein